MGWILGEKFDTVYPHKGSIKVLWESRWKFAVRTDTNIWSQQVLKDGCSVRNPSTLFTMAASTTSRLFSRT